jgi:hypothetical protein
MAIDAPSEPMQRSAKQSSLNMDEAVDDVQGWPKARSETTLPTLQPGGQLTTPGSALRPRLRQIPQGLRPRPAHILTLATTPAYARPCRRSRRASRTATSLGRNCSCAVTPWPSTRMWWTGMGFVDGASWPASKTSRQLEGQDGSERSLDGTERPPHRSASLDADRTPSSFREDIDIVERPGFDAPEDPRPAVVIGLANQERCVHLAGQLPNRASLDPLREPVQQ